MRYSEIISIAKKSLQILPTSLRSSVVRHAIALNALSLADFVGLAILLPLLVTLLGSGIEINGIVFSLENSSGFVLTNFLVFVLLFFLCKALIAFFLQKKQTKIVGNVISHISKKNIKQFLNMNYEKRMETDTSLFSEKVYFQPLQIGQGVFVPLFVLFQESSILLLIVTGILLYSPLISIGLIAILLVSSLVTNKWIKSKTIALGESNIQKRKALFDNLNISLSGMLDIKQNQAQEQYEKELTDKVLALSTGELETNMMRIIPFRVNELISVIGILCLIVFAFYSNSNQNFIVLGSVFALAMFRAIPAINRVQLNLVQIRLYAKQLLSLSEENEDNIEKTTLTQLKNSIQLEKVSIRYRDSGQPILNEISLEIPVGSITVFSGISGSGKSSLLRIIAGQMQTSSGKVLIDGTELHSSNLNSWQNQVSLISQKPFIVKGGIAQNITFGCSEKIDLEKVKEALSMAGLEEFANNLNQKEVGEEGLKISEGQKQRLMLARAIYRQSNVLLLDEITGNLDPENTQLVIRTIKQLKAIGKTIIFISHNPEVLNIADFLCVFKNKQIYINEHSTSQS